MAGSKHNRILRQKVSRVAANSTLVCIKPGRFSSFISLTNGLVQYPAGAFSILSPYDVIVLGFQVTLQPSFHGLKLLDTLGVEGPLHPQDGCGIAWVYVLESTLAEVPTQPDQ